MNRREFLSHAATTALLLGSAGTARAAHDAGATGDASPDELIGEFVRANDEQLPAQLARQERRAEHPAVGGFANEYGIHAIGNTAGFVSSVACAVSARQSRYFQSAELVVPLRLAVSHLLSEQHNDGTIDYFATNFHSPPDTAFILEVVSPACALLRASPVAALAEEGARLGNFIRKAAESLVTGGVHTPNHRWVVCAALAWANSLFPNSRYVARADAWLAEGIDIDPDGQYTERSTTVYSPIVDRALLTVARLLNRPELLEPVRRNLEMTLYYVHPDGEVVTEASRRQDKYQRGSMARYYYSYRHLALRDKNGRFAAMARQIERTARPQLAGELAAFLTEPELARPLPPDAPLPTDYSRVFSHSGVARIRRGAVSGTVLAANSTLFSFRKGAAALEALRVASAFFGKGQFTSEALELRDGAFRLRQRLEGPYFQPLSSEQIAGGEHVRMAPNGTLANDSRMLRAFSNIQHLESVATVTEAGNGFEVALTIRGTDHVPVAVELAFRHGGKLRGVEPVPGIADAFLLRSGTGHYEFNGDVIEFSPGRVEHTYTQVRGALPKWDGQSVYLTGFTPFEVTLRIA